MSKKKNDISVNVRPVADRYASLDERIIEYDSPAGGGLIAFRLADNGKLVVDLYRHDPTVEIRVGEATG